MKATGISILPGLRRRVRRDLKHISRKRIVAVLMGCPVWQSSESSKGANMKRAWVALILLSSAVGLARVGQAKGERTPNEFEQTLMTAEKGFIEAAKKGDRAFFKDTLTADFSYVSFDGQLYERQDMVDQFAQGGVDIQPYEWKVAPAGEG